MNTILSAAGVFGGFTVGTSAILMASTYATCEKIDTAVSFKDGAIAAAVPALAYFLASYFEFLRRPFVDFYINFGVQEPWDGRIAMGHIILIFLWPMIVWSFHDASTKACVASVDEMAKFKTELMAKLSNKQHKDAKNAEAPPKSA
jgi:hypothetical protein